MLLVLVAAVFIIYTRRLGDAPMYMSPDEVIIAVDAHSIATTGRDVEGKLLPLFFNIQMPGETRRGWFFPMIFYVSALFYKVFRFTEGIVRLPTAMLGVTNVVLMFLVARQLFKSDSLALLAAAFLALSPAHFMLSRLGLDYLYPVPFILGWLLCLGCDLENENPRMLLAGGLVLGLGCFSYISSVIMMPFYLLMTFAILRYTRKPARLYAVAAAGLALPLLLIVPWILQNPTVVADTMQRYELGGTKFGYTTIDELVSQYWSFFSPSFLFLTGDQQMMFSTRLVGVFLVSLAVFLPLGIYRAGVVEPTPLNLLLLAGFVTGPLVALLVREPAAIQRSVAILPFVVLLATLGVKQLLSLRLTLGRWRLETLAAVGLLALMLLQFALFQRSYFGEYRLRAAPWYGGNLRGALEELMAIDRRGRVPGVYFATLRATSGLLDIRNRWMDAYWNFYLTKEGRRDLLARTAKLDPQALDAVPPGSLVLANVGDRVTDELVRSGRLKTVTLVDEIDREPFFTILQK